MTGIKGRRVRDKTVRVKGAEAPRKLAILFMKTNHAVAVCDNRVSAPKRALGIRSESLKPGLRHDRRSQAILRRPTPSPAVQAFANELVVNAAERALSFRQFIRHLEGSFKADSPIHIPMFL